MASGKMIRQTASAPITTSMGLSMKASGWMTSKKAWEKRHGKMDLSTRVSTARDTSTVKVFTFGVTGQPTMASGSTTRSTDRESTRGPTAANTLGSGKKIRCTVMAR